MTVDFGGFEHVNSAGTYLDSAFTLQGGASIVTTSPPTGSRCMEVNFNSAAISGTELNNANTLKMRPLVPIYWGLCINPQTTTPGATHNVLEFRVSGAVKRELSINASRELLWANGSNTQIGPTIAALATATNHWFMGETMPWGTRPYDRIWKWNGTGWDTVVDVVYAPVTDAAATPYRDADCTAWGDSTALLGMWVGNTSKAAAVDVIRYDDPWVEVPRNAVTVQEFHAVRPAYLRVARMLPNGDGATVQWTIDTAGGTHASRLDDVPVGDIVSTATDPRDQVDTSGSDKTDLYDLEAMPAGKQPVALKMMVGGREGGAANAIEGTLVSGSDSDLQSLIGVITGSTGTGVALGSNAKVLEHPPNASADKWTETLVNAVQAKIHTVSGNTEEMKVGGVCAEVLYEDNAATPAIRCEPLVAAW